MGEPWRQMIGPQGMAAAGLVAALLLAAVCCYYWLRFLAGVYDFFTRRPPR
jgi:uncharacterized membrane protein YwaF